MPTPQRAGCPRYAVTRCRRWGAGRLAHSESSYAIWCQPSELGETQNWARFAPAPTRLNVSGQNPHRQYDTSGNAARESRGSTGQVRAALPSGRDTPHPITHSPLPSPQGRGKRGISARLRAAGGSRRDPISLAVGETYGDTTLTNPEGVERRHIRPLRGRRKNREARPWVRRFHLRLMIFMPFGHAPCIIRSLSQREWVRGVRGYVAHLHGFRAPRAAGATEMKIGRAGEDRQLQILRPKERASE
jgi:hypothetical protein